jgi:hypothetical protein
MNTKKSIVCVCLHLGLVAALIVAAFLAAIPIALLFLLCAYSIGGSIAFEWRWFVCASGWSIVAWFGFRGFQKYLLDTSNRCEEWLMRDGTAGFWSVFNPCIYVEEDKE